MSLRILLVAFACCLAGTPALAGGDEFTLYLVRHAEKQAEGSRDPALTAAGKQRAEQLADWLRDKDIEDIWTSDYKRTRGTAAPLLSRPGLVLKFYDPRNLPGLAEILMQRRKSALVVGHSNTTPELARLLCECDVADMDESEYDRLIMMTIGGDGAHTETLDQSELFEHQKP